MRLLACFSRRAVVVQPPVEDAIVSKPPPDPTAFTPTSIPELHPEYAHAEPYCFAARTDSARVIVDKMRGAKGQPSVDRAAILKEQGVVVVRGPSYTANKIKELQQEQKPTPKKTPHVPLQVETPTTVGRYVDSDDNTSVDENVDVNVRPRKSTLSSTALSPKSRTTSKKAQSRSWIKSRKKKSFKRKTGSNVSSEDRVISEHASSGRVSEDILSRNYHRDFIPSIPSPPPSDDLHHVAPATRPDLVKKHMDNTPQELLAPIMVPRMSGAFNRPQMQSPTISNDSWTATDAQRYEDVEGDTSSSFMLMSGVGKEKVVHKATHSPRPPAEESSAANAISMFLDTSTSPSTISKTPYSKRKSKPFKEPLPSLAAPADRPISPPPKQLLNNDPVDSSDDLGPIPDRNVLSRQISIGVFSDDIEIVDTPAVDDIMPLPTRASIANAHRGELGTMSLPRVTTHASGMVRKNSNSKRKTVSFHNASPTIIEPNMKAPFQSVPRDVMFSKEKTVATTSSEKVGDSEPEVPKTAVLTKDKVKLAPLRAPTPPARRAAPKPEAPRTVMIPRDLVKKALESRKVMEEAEEITAEVPEKLMPALRDTKVDRVDPPARASSARAIPAPKLEDRQTSNASFTSDESFSARASRRMSMKVRDKKELKEASKRQSVAVAAALTDQIRGVPRSAMLAFTDHEVELADSFDSSDMDSSLASLKRKSRVVSKTIEVPEIKPGVIPKPPPPPPFTPSRPKFRSLRKPPPPPSSPSQVHR